MGLNKFAYIDREREGASMKFLKELERIVPVDRLYIEEMMDRHTTFKVGGPADYLVDVDSVETLKAVIELCRGNKVDYAIIGNGSNLLVGDLGYRGVILKIAKGLSYMEVTGNQMRVGAGTMLVKAAGEAYKQSFTGFEFAAGIPGTIGGAAVMNAGAYGGEMKDVLKSAKVLTKDGEIIELNTGELELGYRTSIIMSKSYIVLEVLLEFEKGDAQGIKDKMDQYKEARVTKQPLQYPSAGSAFKRPEGYFAGKLVDDAGLRGYKVGGAQISEKHCGFAINTGGATAKDVKKILEQVSEKVWNQFQVRLETEVKFLGEFEK